MAIGARIREARQRLGVSITDLGLAYGGHRQTVQFWEKGKNFPPLSDFIHVCTLLRTDANHLLGAGPPRDLSDKEILAARLEIQTLARKHKEEKLQGAHILVAPRRRLRRSHSRIAPARRA